MNADFLETELAAVRSLMAETARMNEGRTSAAVSGLLAAGGKLLRPRILLLSAMTGRYEASRIRPLAAAVELLHTATLIHDDVIDDSPTRRGLPATHVLTGRKQAVLAGDFLFSRCFLLAADRTSPENARYLAKAIDVIVSAEISQDAGRWSFGPSLRSCLRKIGGKTAVLFSLAARAGATEAHAPRSIVSALSRAAWSAGVAFQIQDDILDWTGTEKTLGKAVLNDLSGGYCTIPLALALADPENKLKSLLTVQAVEAGSATEVASIVRSSGALEKSAELARSYRDRALRELQVLPDSFVRDQLVLIFSSFINRTY